MVEADLRGVSSRQCLRPSRLGLEAGQGPGGGQYLGVVVAVGVVTRQWYWLWRTQAHGCDDLVDWRLHVPQANRRDVAVRNRSQGHGHTARERVTREVEVGQRRQLLDSSAVLASPEASATQSWACTGRVQVVGSLTPIQYDRPRSRVASVFRPGTSSTAGKYASHVPAASSQA